MRNKERRGLIWACVLCLWAFVGSGAQPHANPGCEYTNMGNAGSRGGQSDEYTVLINVLYDNGAVNAWPTPLKICLFKDETPCFPELPPKRLELKPLEDHLSAQAPAKYFQVDSKLKHPGFLSGKVKPEFEKRYYDLTFKLRSLSCLSGRCQERFKGSTITGALAMCTGPPLVFSDKTAIPWGEFQEELETYVRDLEVAAKEVEALMKACNIGKRDTKYFELGRALVQMQGPTSPIHTIEICLFNPGAHCFPDKDETNTFLKFIEDKVIETGGNITALTSGAGKVYDLRSWSCWTGTCEEKTLECALGQRVSKVLQFTELVNGGYRLRPHLQSLVTLILIFLVQTLFISFPTFYYRLPHLRNAHYDVL